MTPETLAESIEKTRFELMRGQRWADLRASERETRVDLARRALVESGVADQLDAVRRQADRVPDLESLVARHERDLAVLEGRLEAERADHAARAAELEAQLGAVRQERDRAEARLGATEDVLDAVRELVTSPVEVLPDPHGAAAGAPPVVAAVPTPATDGTAHGRRPVFRLARSAPAT
jgi:septal ring factor EnvC (AmiA/AmiB activator)